jgi:hypothetical protein
MDVSLRAVRRIFLSAPSIVCVLLISVSPVETRLPSGGGRNQALLSLLGV